MHDPLCEQDVISPGPDHTEPSYTHFFKKSDGTRVDLQADEYDPIETGKHPALVLVHGGGWRQGCTHALNEEATALSKDPLHLFSQHFVVFVIDYRLSCDSSEEPFAGSPIEDMCDWTFRDIDSRTGNPAAVTDEQLAVKWVKDTWGRRTENVNRWNGKVGLVGASSGGNLAAVAAATTTNRSQKPDAVALWSAPLEMQVMSTGVYGCDPFQSSSPDNCWHRSDDYLLCQRLEPDPSCVNDPITHQNIFAKASPITYYTSNTLPPIFFANAGGPVAGSSSPELIGLQEADDFAQTLRAVGFNPSAFFECRVDATKHATGYLNDPDHPCEGVTGTPAPTVFQSTVGFLASKVA